MTPAQAKKLPEFAREILEHGASAICIRGVWHWSHQGEPCGRIVRSLVKRGLMDVQYYRGGRAAACKTDAGRQALSLALN